MALVIPHPPRYFGVVKKFKVVLRSITDPTKTKIKSVTATDMAEAMSKAEQGGWIASGASEMGSSGLSMSALRNAAPRASKFEGKELVRFCRGMSVMLSAGISIVDALEFYTSTLPSKGLKAVLLQVQESLKSGDSPNVAFSRTKAFSPLFVGLVTAGAASGDLGSALRSLAKQLELQLQLKSKIRKIVMLPSVVIALLSGIFLAAQLVVTPKIENMLTANGVAPDAFSKVIFQMAKITEAIWVPVVLAVIAAVVTVALSPKVREFILNVGMSRLRSVREVVMGVRQTTFVGTLSMLQNSGIVMEEALGITAGVMSGTPMGREVEEVRNQYLTGLDVSKCVRQFTSCDPTVVHMIAIGEKTGQLPEQLTLCAGMVEDQTKDAMDILSSRVQTMSTVIPVVLIAFIFVSSYLPIVMMSAQMMKSID